MDLFFIPIRLVDLLDVAIVTYLLYTLYRLMRGTIAIQIFIGLMALYLTDVIVTAADMTMMRFLFGTVRNVFVLALIILFQPEIRRLLLLLGQTPIIQRFVRGPEASHVVKETLAAVKAIREQQMGALLVFARASGLRTYIETGTLIEASVSRGLLQTLFLPDGPLHDGAVIIQNQRIEAAGCILPVSDSQKISTQYGLRHRAAVGLSEQTDAFVIVVSEETGQISTALHGVLTPDLSWTDLRARLIASLSSEPQPTLAATPDEKPRSA